MLTDTQPIYAIQLTEAPIPKPRVRFRDYRCISCAMLLMRASLDNVVMALPADFAKTNPLAHAALKSIVVEIRCPRSRCGAINSFVPAFQENGKGYTTTHK